MSGKVLTAVPQTRASHSGFNRRTPAARVEIDRRRRHGLSPEARGAARLLAPRRRAARGQCPPAVHSFPWAPLTWPLRFLSPSPLPGRAGSVESRRTRWTETKVLRHGESGNLLLVAHARGLLRRHWTVSERSGERVLEVYAGRVWWRRRRHGKGERAVQLAGGLGCPNAGAASVCMLTPCCHPRLPPPPPMQAPHASRCGLSARTAPGPAWWPPRSTAAWW